ncbi:MAG TPA: MoaD/ThiS family protein [Rhizomicrobium sp.]|nr:MoaD/ThiS family protein [Rhizomicrobium sp.]
MTIRVQLPPVLRSVSGGRAELQASGNTIGEVLEDLARTNPALALHFFDEAHAIRRNIVCIHDGELVRANCARTHAVRPGDEIVLANALAGG